MSKELQRGIIVSVQGFSSGTNNEICDAVIDAGCCGIRTDKPIRNRNVPVIGLIKKKTDHKEQEAYITADIESVKKVSEWADYVAIDYRIVNHDIEQISEYCKTNKIKIIADIRDIEDYFNITSLGVYFDFVATTFSIFGRRFDPDLKLLDKLKEAGCKKIIGEGNYSRYKDVRDAYRAGAYAMCIGGAISDPYKLARRFTTIELDN